MPNASNEARPSGRVIYRKIVLRLIPFLVVCDILSVIDRLNIGFAKLQFMRDLSLNEAVVGMTAGVFYFGFTIFEIPIHCSRRDGLLLSGRSTAKCEMALE